MTLTSELYPAACNSAAVTPLTAHRESNFLTTTWASAGETFLAAHRQVGELARQTDPRLPTLSEGIVELKLVLAEVQIKGSCRSAEPLSVHRDKLGRILVVDD